LHQLAFPPAVYEGFFFPTSLPTPVGGGVFDDGYRMGILLISASQVARIIGVNCQYPAASLFFTLIFSLLFFNTVV
jgi:hypothetical protein